MKTFYSVNYRSFVNGLLEKEWFDNLSEAKEFKNKYSFIFCDDIIAHNFKDQDIINYLNAIIDDDYFTYVEYENNYKFSKKLKKYNI